MEKTRKIGWFLIAWFAWIPLHAQDIKPASPVITDEAMLSYREKIFVHINTNFLLAGETVYCSVYCLEAEHNTPSLLSSVAYIEIVDKERRPFLQTKVMLRDGRGSAEFFLPSGMPSGNYTVVAYTRWMKNFSADAFFRTEFTVVNPFVNQERMHGAPERPAVQLQENLRSEDISMTISAALVKPREKIILTLQNEDSVDEASLSVNVHVLEKAIPTKHENEIRVTNSDNPDHLLYLPELRGPLISGTLYNRNDHEPLKNQIVYLSAANPHPVFLVSHTDTVGHFYFDGTELPSRQELIWQVPGRDSSTFKVELENNFLPNYSGFAPSPYAIDSSLFRSLEKRSMYSQIQNAYYQEDSTALLQRNQPEPFYGIPDKAYNLDEFTRFPTMEDVFREFIPDVIVRKRRESFELRVVNPVNGIPFAEAPLLLIDGIPVSEATVMAFDPYKARRIETVRKRYFYSALTLEGIVSIETYERNPNVITLPTGLRTAYEGPELPRDFQAPQYPSAELDRIPDFRTQLYWNPNVHLKSKSVLQFEVFASDFQGDFLIEVRGLSSHGKYIRLQKQITVRE